MKLKNRFFVILIVVVAVTILASYGIVMTNNFLADRIEKELIAYQLPKDTALVDSLAAAGKLVGNGNGMQYMGSILVESELSADELLAYYSSRFEFVEVRIQTSEAVDFINLRGHNFDKFPKEPVKTYYSITCWDDNRKELVGDFIGTLLDLDFRGY